MVLKDIFSESKEPLKRPTQIKVKNFLNSKFYKKGLFSAVLKHEANFSYYSSETNFTSFFPIFLLGRTFSINREAI